MADLFSGLFGKKKCPYKPADIYLGLRQRALDLSKSTEEERRLLGNSDRLAIMMETGLNDYCFTLVAVSDGAASVYLSNGGGMIGAGQHPEGARAAKDLLEYSKDFESKLAKVSEYPLPSPGMTRFYVVEPGVVLSAEFKDEDLAKNRSPLSPLFHKGHELIATIRSIDGRMKTESPLLNAIWDDAVDSVNKLLKDGAPPNILDSHGIPPLAIAVSREQVAIVQALLSSGADPNVKFSNEKRKFKDAPLVNFAVAFGNLDILAILRDAGADLESSDSTGLSPLMAAASAGNADVLNYLIRAGCRLESRDESGQTALMFACNSGHLNCVEALVSAGADVNALDKAHSTPVMFAAQYGFSDIVKSLLAHGADAFVRGTHGLSALEFAKQNHHVETVGILMQAINKT